jgi:molecular chaperone GrpE
MKQQVDEYELEEHLDEETDNTARDAQPTSPPETTIEPTQIDDAAGEQPEAAVEQPALVEPDLQAEVERLKTEAAVNLEGWQRERAEFVNYKKRSEAERSQLVFLTGVKIVERLLPVIDDFDRALANLPDDLKDNGWIDGVRITRRKLIGILESEGLSIIPVAPGDAFDPTVHEAISHEDSDEFAEGQIIAELQTGYRIGDRVLRPSLVRVAR